MHCETEVPRRATNEGALGHALFFSRLPRRGPASGGADGSDEAFGSSQLVEKSSGDEIWRNLVNESSSSLDRQYTRACSRMETGAGRDGAPGVGAPGGGASVSFAPGDPSSKLLEL